MLCTESLSVLSPQSTSEEGGVKSSTAEPNAICSKSPSGATAPDVLPGWFCVSVACVECAGCGCNSKSGALNPAVTAAAPSVANPAVLMSQLPRAQFGRQLNSLLIADKLDKHGDRKR